MTEIVYEGFCVGDLNCIGGFDVSDLNCIGAFCIIQQGLKLYKIEQFFGI